MPSKQFEEIVAMYMTKPDMFHFRLLHLRKGKARPYTLYKRNHLIEAPIYKGLMNKPVKATVRSSPDRGVMFRGLVISRLLSEDCATLLSSF